MKTTYTIIISVFLLFSLSGNAANYSGCLIENNKEISKLKISTGDAIGQSFKPCEDGFLGHFTIYTSGFKASQGETYLNVYEVVNNKFQFIHQETKLLPESNEDGKLTFWINGRIPMYSNSEYAVEILNLSSNEFEVIYSGEDSYHFGSMIKNGKFTFSDLSFTAGIKNSIKPIRDEFTQINEEFQSEFSEGALLQSWSNKSIEIEYGDIGQEFGVEEFKQVNTLAIKLKNTKNEANGVLEIYKNSLEMANKIHSQKIIIPANRGEFWGKYELSKILQLAPEKKYFFSIKFENPNEGIRFYYSTADDYENGNMFMGDLSMNECDLSFFLQSENEDFMQEIEWLEENDFEQLEDSPLSKQIAIENKLKINAFPNPFDSQFMLSYSNFKVGKTVTVAISNQSGTLLWMNNFIVDTSEGVLTINPELNFSTGKYSIRVLHNEQIVNTTIISK